MATTIRLPTRSSSASTIWAASTKRSRSFYLREAVVRALPELEWEYGIAQRAEDARSGRAKTVTLEQAVKDLGLDD